MSGQMIELIIFAAIAFFVINKLISTLGSTDDDLIDNNKNKSFFGEPKGMKDVTASVRNTAGIFGGKIIAGDFILKSKINLGNLVKKENAKAVREGIVEVMEKIPSFEINKFAKCAKLAFEAIIDYKQQKKSQDLEELVDKRYLPKFLEIKKFKYLYNIR